MFFGVTRAEEFDSHDYAEGVERDQQIVRAGITDDVVRLRRGREQAPDDITASIDDEVEAVLGVAKLNSIGCGKNLSCLSNRDKSRTPPLEPARLLMDQQENEPHQPGAIEA